MAIFQRGPFNGYGHDEDDSYGQPAAPYGAPAPWGQIAPAQQYSYGYPPKEKPYAAPWGQNAPPPYANGTGAPPKAQPYGNPFASLLPSKFPPGTDKTIVSCFQAVDQDGNGFIDDRELKSALSSYNKSFSLSTIRLLMYLFTNSNNRMIGPKEFTYLFTSLQNWRTMFQRFDRDRSGDINASELREALLNLGYTVSPSVLELIMSKYDKSGGKNMVIDFDKFIECCITIKGLMDKFKEKDTANNGWATFSLESFMLTVLPFVTT